MGGGVEDWMRVSKARMPSSSSWPGASASWFARAASSRRRRIAKATRETGVGRRDGRGGGEGRVEREVGTAAARRA